MTAAGSFVGILGRGGKPPHRVDGGMVGSKARRTRYGSLTQRCLLRARRSEALPRWFGVRSLAPNQVDGSWRFSSGARRSAYRASSPARSKALGAQVALALEGASLAEDLHRRQNETRFHSLVANSSDLITVLDANGIVTYQSPSIERVLGYTVEEVEGKQFDWILSESDRALLEQVVEHASDGAGESHVTECSLTRTTTEEW